MQVQHLHPKMDMVLIRIEPKSKSNLVMPEGVKPNEDQFRFYVESVGDMVKRVQVGDELFATFPVGGFTLDGKPHHYALVREHQIEATITIEETPDTKPAVEVPTGQVGDNTKEDGNANAPTE